MPRMVKVPMDAVFTRVCRIAAGIVMMCGGAKIVLVGEEVVSKGASYLGR